MVKMIRKKLKLKSYMRENTNINNIICNSYIDSANSKTHKIISY